MLKDRGEDVPNVRTFRNAVLRAFDPVHLAAIEKGELGLVEMRMYSDSDPTARNELWQCDTVDLDMVVLERPGGKRRRRPKVTLVIDDSTGAIMGWSMSFNDTKASVLVALRDAMVVRAEAGPFGGVPDHMIVDQGSNMVSNAVKEASVLAGFRTEALEGAAPWLKGKVEATVKAVNRNFSVRFPHYTGGRKTRQGKPQIPDSDPPSLDLVRREFDVWVKNRNAFHVIEREEDSRAPLERWEAQEDVPLRPISKRAAAALLKERKKRTIGKKGIRLDKVRYVCDLMPRHRGKRVVIAYMPRDRRVLDVFIDGKWMFTAKPLNSLSPRELTSYRNACREALKEPRREVNRLRRASKAEIAPITGGGEAVEDTGVVPEEEASFIRRNSRHSEAREANQARNRLAGASSTRNQPLEIPEWS
jgi:transposase InsO family protein